MKQVDSFFFGSENKLFAMYHPASGFSRGQGVVICPPLFHEYYRSHFTNRRIAAELARKGYDVLRFDYSGTGDSKGNIPDRLFEIWSDEIGDALRTVRQLGGYRKVSIVAERFSAALALPWQEDLGKYVCWDPVIDAVEYRDQIDALNAASLAEHRSMPEDERAKHTETDFLGTGLRRDTIVENLTRFTKKIGANGVNSLPEGTVDIESDVEWISASLEMVYAHDVIKRVSEAM